MAIEKRPTRFVRAKEANLNAIPFIDGQFILTDAGHIYADFPNNVRRRMSFTLSSSNDTIIIEDGDNGTVTLTFNEDSLNLANIAKTANINDLQQNTTDYVVLNCGTATINI